jgi:hypothetical protein
MFKRKTRDGLVMDGNQYKVISSLDHGELSEKVTKLMKDGWQPQGGLVTKQYNQNDVRFYQAMVYYEPR